MKVQAQRIEVIAGSPTSYWEVREERGEYEEDSFSQLVPVTGPRQPLLFSVQTWVECE